MDNTIRMTEHGHDYGCGCKISPKVLDTLPKTEHSIINYPTQLMGNSSCDDTVSFLEIGMKSALTSVMQKASANISNPLVLM